MFSLVVRQYSRHSSSSCCSFLLYFRCIMQTPSAFVHCTSSRASPSEYQRLSNLLSSAKCVQDSLTSEMQNMSFRHINHFLHRHFPETPHDFRSRQSQEFLRIVALDMATVASHPAFGVSYIANHPHSGDANTTCGDAPDPPSEKKPRRKQDRRVLPKHFYIDDWHRSDYNRGELCMKS